MFRSRKGGLLLLGVAVLWSVLPAGACLLTGHATARPACCTEMPQDCPTQGANMNAPCCQAHSGNPALVADTPLALDHLQTALAPNSLAPAVLDFAANPIPLISEAPPPTSPPGANSILRI
ncbi:MAG TPA: hypothetical protein VGR47_00815 [Terracidiphilus sp.]|nr:hypothetical protein [Terracidiphilus sp.]